MRRFQDVRRIAHSADDMFELVADVERYPQFVPLCADLTVRSREAAGQGRERVVADMTAAYKALRETFTSRVTLDRPGRTILVEYVDGPFRHLENRWSFTVLDPATCSVDFFIAYEFRSFALQFLAGAVFDRAFARFVDAFAARADALYGVRRKSSI